MIPKQYLNRTSTVDALDGVANLEDQSVDVVVTSPPYWGQRESLGIGEELDPREYLDSITSLFSAVLPKMKSEGIVWLNVGDSYNTDINWREEDRVYSTLGADKNGLPDHNSAYTKRRTNRKAFVDKEETWLKKNNLLALPMRMVLSLVDEGYYYRGEVIWSKPNAMPEGRTRRPHRTHESIFLFAKSSKHAFTTERVKSVWEFNADKGNSAKHCSRFPLELPRRCIDAYGKFGEDIVVLDLCSGSGTTGIAALELGCSFVGFEIDSKRTSSANQRFKARKAQIDQESDAIAVAAS